MGSKIKCSHALVKKLSEAQDILDLVKMGEKMVKHIEKNPSPNVLDAYV